MIKYAREQFLRTLEFSISVMEQKKLFNILALSSLFITYSPESNFCNGGMFGEWLQFQFIEFVKMYIPVKIITIRPNDKPWFNSFIRRAMCIRDRHSINLFVNLIDISSMFSLESKKPSQSNRRISELRFIKYACLYNLCIILTLEIVLMNQQGLVHY
jgi:hypothetical protein